MVSKIRRGWCLKRMAAVYWLVLLLLGGSASSYKLDELHLRAAGEEEAKVSSLVRTISAHRLIPHERNNSNIIHAAREADATGLDAVRPLPSLVALPGGYGSLQQARRSLLAGKPHPKSKGLGMGMGLAKDRGCPGGRCNLSELNTSRRRPGSKIAWVMSLCDEPLDPEELDHLSCETHDIFLIEKCRKPSERVVLPKLQSCTQVLDWSWCVQGKKHCTNFYFIVKYYEQLESWAAVYFLKGRHNGQAWRQTPFVKLEELSTRLLDHDITFEDIGNKVRPWSYKRGAGRAWIPTVKMMACGYVAKSTAMFGGTRNNFMVSTSRILIWPKCKYQSLFNLMHYPPKGINMASMKQVWEFFEHVYGYLFSCRPNTKTDWQNFQGVEKPHLVCYGNATVSEYPLTMPARG